MRSGRCDRQGTEVSIVDACRYEIGAPAGSSALSSSKEVKLDKCYFCGELVVGDDADLHHPGRARGPEYTVVAHRSCHTQHHSENGDFSKWGSLGYQAALESCPEFHARGGHARASAAMRDKKGRFT